MSPDLSQALFDPDTKVCTAEEILEDILRGYAQALLAEGAPKDAITLLASEISEDFENLVGHGKMPRHRIELMELLEKRKDHISRVCYQHLQEGHD